MSTNPNQLYFYWSGGPEGYVLDLHADTRTNGRLRTAPGISNHPSAVGGFLGDSWDTGADEDWYRIELTQGYEYKVELWADAAYPEKHKSTQLKILGIHDSNGREISGTSSPDSGRHVSVTFRPVSTGQYYISVGSAGSDRTGVYSIRVTGRVTE